MFANAKRPEIDNHTLKLIVGLIPLTLGGLTSFFAPTSITSISASYWEGGWSQNIFVGFLFAVSAFLLAYNGESTREMVLSKLAACAALGVAMFPCKCDNHQEIIPYAHGISAAAMFVILAIFCYVFFQRAHSKGHTQAKVRVYIYAVCGITITLAILALAFDQFSSGLLSSKIDRFTYYGECAGLFAFGFSWLTASRCLPFITSEAERLSLSPFS